MSYENTRFTKCEFCGQEKQCFTQYEFDGEHILCSDCLFLTDLD